jgi:hypothetical protein
VRASWTLRPADRGERIWAALKNCVASTAVSWPGRLRQIRSFFRARSPEQMLATAAPWHVGPNLIRMPPINTLDPGDLALSNSITLVAIAPINTESGAEGASRRHLGIQAKTGG